MALCLAYNQSCTIVGRYQVFTLCHKLGQIFYQEPSPKCLPSWTQCVHDQIYISFGGLEGYYLCVYTVVWRTEGAWIVGWGWGGHSPALTKHHDFLQAPPFPPAHQFFCHPLQPWKRKGNVKQEKKHISFQETRRIKRSYQLQPIWQNMQAASQEGVVDILSPTRSSSGNSDK